MSERSRRHRARREALQLRCARREALQLRCARQREQLAESLTAVQQHLQPIDRALMAVRALRRTHLLFGGLAALGAAAGMLFAGRTRRARGSRFSLLLPLAGPLLKLLETWWRQRRAPPSARPVSETPDPHRP